MSKKYGKEEHVPSRFPKGTPSPRIKKGDREAISADILEEEMHMLTDPVAMCSFWGSEDLYPWQAHALRSLFKDGSRVALKTPNESGKTSVVIAFGGLSLMSLYPGCQIVSTAGSFRQVSEQLWPVVRGCVSKYPRWKITEDSLTAPSVDGMPPSTWIIFSTDDSKKAEGYHTRYSVDKHGIRRKRPLVYIIDEAKTVDTGIFQAVYRCDPDHVLITSTPGEEEGEFFNIFNGDSEMDMRDVKGKDSAFWTRINVTWADCPHLLEGRKKDLRDYLIKKFGQNDPFVQSMVYGNFYRVGGFFIFEVGNVDKCMNWVGNVFELGRESRAAVDLSGPGDKTIFAHRRGNIMDSLIRVEGKNHTEKRKKLEKLFKEYNMAPGEITVDEGGLGGPVVDQLEENGWKGIRRYKFDGEARNKDRYTSIGMEDHHRLALWINEKCVGLYKDDVLRGQMHKRKYEMLNRNSGKMSLEPKERVRKREGGSPDELDTVVMLYSNMKDPLAGGARKQASGFITFMGVQYSVEELMSGSWNKSGSNRESDSMDYIGNMRSDT